MTPPLALSHSLVEFRATALGDRSTAVLYVINSTTAQGHSGHMLPRVDREALASAGTRLFAFSLPEGSPISISPSSGHVLSGEVLEQLSLSLIPVEV